MKVNTDPLRDAQQEEPVSWKDGNEIYQWEKEIEKEEIQDE